MTTNAQAALQAAATVYEGARGHAHTPEVRALAVIFKQWLDEQDQADKLPRLTEYDLPESPVSHHIRCRSRLTREDLACNCRPVPYIEPGSQVSP